MPVEGTNPLINARDRLFRALFFKMALMYARSFPPPVRLLLEMGVLMKVFIFILFDPWYLRMSFRALLLSYEKRSVVQLAEHTTLFI